MTPRFLVLLVAAFLLTFVNAQSTLIEIRAQRELAAPCPKTKYALETKRKAVQIQDAYYSKQLAEWEQVAQDLTVSAARRRYAESRIEYYSGEMVVNHATLIRLEQCETGQSF